MTSAKPLKLLLVDDHELFRDGLAGLLNQQTDLQVVGQASNGTQAVQQARQLQPDVILMDIDMPIMDGLTATRLIMSELPQTKIVMLTIHEEEAKLFEAIKSGAQGYLLKNIRSAEMIEMLQGIGAGEAAISRRMAGWLLREFSRQPVINSNVTPTPETHQPTGLEALTGREEEVLELVAHRASNKEIAQQLSISEYTVKNHLRNILAKLHLANRNQAAQLAQSLKGKR